MSPKPSLFRVLLLPALGALAACGSTEKVYEDHRVNTQFVQSLEIPVNQGEMEFRRYPFTIAIAPPQFSEREVYVEGDPNKGKIESSSGGTGEKFSIPQGPSGRSFIAVPLQGADKSDFLTDQQSQVAWTSRTNPREKKAEAAGLENKPENKPENKADPKSGGKIYNKKPKSRQEGRRVLLGSVDGMRSLPLGINSPTFERQLQRRLYYTGDEVGMGYGGAEGEADKGPEKAESSGAAELKPGKKDVKESFTKEKIVKWEQTTNDEDIASRPGWVFQFDKLSYTNRIKSIFDQFALFEESKVLTKDIEKFEQLCDEADDKYADLVMITKVKRYKVAYHGVSLGYIPSTLAYLTLWFPAWWIPDEEFKVHLDVQVDINDVRSRSNVFHTKIEVVTSDTFSDFDRSFRFFGHYLTPGIYEPYHGQGSFRKVAETLWAQAWQRYEQILLQRLHTTFKQDIDVISFEDRINDGVDTRQFGLVACVSKYGPNAKDVLENFHKSRLIQASGNPNYNVEQLREDLQDNQAAFGVRSYAENDGDKMAEVMLNGQEVGVKAHNLSKLYGQEATRAELLTRLHRLTRARREDRTFVYLNLETVVVDIDQKDSPDGLAKYLLPYDCNLEALEQQLSPLRARLTKLRQGQLSSLQRQIRQVRSDMRLADKEERKKLQRKYALLNISYKEACDRILEQNPTLFKEFQTTVKSFFDKNAVSFAWIADQFNRDTTNPLKDHVYLQSKNVLLVIDGTFPGQFTDLHYAPKFELSLGSQPVELVQTRSPEDKAETDPDKKDSKLTAEDFNQDEPGKSPGSQDGDLKPGDIEVNKPDKDTKTDADPKQGSGQNPKDGSGKDPKDSESKAEKKEDRKVLLGQRPLKKSSYYAALRAAVMAVGDKKSGVPAAGNELEVISEEQVGISESFLRRLVRPGRIVVLTSLGSQRLLDIVEKRLGAFSYHFTKGALSTSRVPPSEVMLDGKKTEQTRLLDVLSYVSRRVGRESRALGTPQNFGLYRKGRSDFVLVQTSSSN